MVRAAAADKECSIVVEAHTETMRAHTTAQLLYLPDPVFPSASCTGITTGGTQGSVRLSDAAVGSVQDESQPVYEVTTVLDSSTTSSKGGMFQYMALVSRLW